MWGGAGEEEEKCRGQLAALPPTDLSKRLLQPAPWLAYPGLACCFTQQAAGGP